MGSLTKFSNLFNILVQVFLITFINCATGFNEQGTREIIRENLLSGNQILEVNRVQRSLADSLRKLFGVFRTTSCSTQNFLLRHYKTTGQCYEIGSKGPCGRNMIFYAESDNNQYGVCDCAHAHETRTLIYHQTTNQCYFVFQQGYCVFGQWLVINPRTKQPKCETNPCLKFTPISLLDTTVEYEGICVRLNSPCGEKKVVKFVSELLLPRCESSSASSKAIGSPVQSCKFGSAYAYNGRCVPVFVW